MAPVLTQFLSNYRVGKYIEQSATDLKYRPLMKALFTYA